MNTLNPNTPEHTHPANLPNWLKKASLGIMTVVTIVFLMVAQADVTFADDDCKTTTGQCSTSIGLYVG